MGFNDWINIEPVSAGPEQRFEEIDSIAKDKLAEQVEGRLKGRIHQGLDTEASRRSQSIRSFADGGRIVIDYKDRGDALTGEAKEKKGNRSSPKGLQDLFEPSSGVPEVVTGPDGQTSLAYRTIDYDKLFSEQYQNEQDQAVERTVTETLRMGMVESMEDATDEVKQKHPEDD